MPQIWVTFQELADFLRLELDEAATSIAEMDLPSRRCSDGLTRIKLPPGLAAAVAASVPAVRQAVLVGERMRALPLRDIDEPALTAAAEAGGSDYVAGEFTDLLVSRLRSVQAIVAQADR
ncbi:hypothetical protein J8J40_21465, partial [Mycobacterium tuberculosis]|nr:hypothetical protein [Mycobacterium tuberculosis]